MTAGRSSTYDRRWRISRVEFVPTHKGDYFPNVDDAVVAGTIEEIRKENWWAKIGEEALES